MASTLLLAGLWLLTHRYQGLSQDARIYAMQALAILDPTLRTDLYLQNTSQDRYTIFSPFYAQVIRLLGLLNAARLLTVVFTAGFIVAAWHLAKSLLDSDEAWLAAGALIIVVGAYGSYGVFHYAEDYLTARSAAEMLVVTALACHTRGFRRTAFLIATFAMPVHPLMALPGMLSMIFLTVPLRAAVALALAGIALVTSVAMAAWAVPGLRTIFPTLDADWLPIVTERSQFLFPQLWTLRDWEINLRPFASLALSAIVLADKRIRNLCAVASLVGASGLLVAFVAGTIGPVALLVQGQAWRWMWLTALVGVILLIPTAIRLWREDNVGPLCALLLAASWTVSAGNTPSFAIGALALFCFRTHISAAAGRYLNVAALGLGMILFAWQCLNAGTTASSAGSGSDATTQFLQSSVAIAALRLPLTIAFILVWQFIRHSTTYRPPLALGTALGAACFLLMPIAFAKTDAEGSAAQVSEFADWRNAIPPSAAVYVANGHDAASFAWFTLQRPNYLSLDQSAGVIFSRSTALEVARRSRVLLPLMDEDWKLLSRNNAGAAAAHRRTPLTAKSLANVCSDPQLDFLIARADVGFDPLRHRQAGPWKDWNLYDCAHVRQLARAMH